MFTKIYNTLLYLTGNQDQSKKEWREDEVKFDIGFMITLFISMGLALLCWILGVGFKLIGVFQPNPTLLEVGSILIEGGWIFVVVVFFIEAYDALRHNRSWDE